MLRAARSLVSSWTSWSVLSPAMALVLMAAAWVVVMPTSCSSVSAAIWSELSAAKAEVLSTTKSSSSIAAT